MTELIKVTYQNDEPVVSARELHEFLEVGTRYNDWFPRMCEYGFFEGQDYYSILSNSTGGRPAQDSIITIDMAKELCMLQRNDKGKVARQYFIQLEKDWNSPEKVMARALRIADKKIKELEAENAAMSPKAKYFDALVDRNLLTNFRETAKELKVPPKSFVSFLLDQGYIYRDRKGKLLPYEEKNKGLFEVKECVSEKNQWSGTQTLVTPKGRETFRLMMARTIC